MVDGNFWVFCVGALRSNFSPRGGAVVIDKIKLPTAENNFPYRAIHFLSIHEDEDGCGGKDFLWTSLLEHEWTMASGVW
jgi:hypothetical protein